MKSRVRFVFCFLLIAFLPFAGFGQDRKFAIGLMSSVDFNTVKLKDHISYDVGKRINNSIGANVYFRFGKRLELKAGLLYASKGYSLKFDPDRAEAPDGQFFGVERSELKANYIEVPIILGVKVFEKGRFTIVPGVGIVTSFGAGATKETRFANGASGIQKVSGWHWGSLYSPMAEIRFNYKLNDKFSLGATPYYRHYIEHVNSRTEITKPNSFGASFELKYSFK